MTIHPQLTETIPGHYENDEYVFFWSGVFSNWISSLFSYDTKTEYGIVIFSSSEQAMMFHKAYLFGDHDSILRIMSTSSPREQKAFGKKVIGFDVEKWQSVCVDIITNTLVHKFNSSDTLKHILLATGDKHIVEASPHDAVWGIGMSVMDPDLFDTSKWGKNFLGICLMNARAIINKELEETYHIQY